MNNAGPMNVLNSVLNLSEYSGFLYFEEFAANARYISFLFLENKTAIHCSEKVPKFHGRVKDWV